MISKYRSSSFSKYFMRSRVTPAISSTMARRTPANQLKMLDLPTFGRPTMDTCGMDIGIFVFVLRNACVTITRRYIVTTQLKRFANYWKKKANFFLLKSEIETIVHEMSR